MRQTQLGGEIVSKCIAIWPRVALPYEPRELAAALDIPLRHVDSLGCDELALLDIESNPHAVHHGGADAEALQLAAACRVLCRAAVGPERYDEVTHALVAEVALELCDVTLPELSAHSHARAERFVSWIVSQYDAR